MGALAGHSDLPKAPTSSPQRGDISILRQMAPQSLSETLKAQSRLRGPHLRLLLRSWGRPLVAVKAHVAAQPLLGVEHLAAVLADESAPWLCPVAGAPVLLVTAGRGRRGRRDSVPIADFFRLPFSFQSLIPTTLDGL